MAFLPTIRWPGSYAFSPIGFSGTVAGGGDTENSRYSTAVKYRVAIGDFRAAALWQFGGYELNNGSNGAFGAELGGDFRLGLGVISLDAIGNYNKDAVNLTLSGTPTDTAGVPIGTMLSQTVTATLSDNTNVMVLAKYTTEELKLYAGYEWMQFAPPSNPFTVAGTGFTTIVGDFVCLDCATAIAGTNISSTAYSASAGFKDKVLQVFWFGARYSITESVDVVGAYYHYDQNNFAAGAANLAACNISSSNKNFCAGTMDATSVMIDWRFTPKGTLISVPSIPRLMADWLMVISRATTWPRQPGSACASDVDPMGRRLCWRCCPPAGPNLSVLSR
jgi:predicted porin